MNVWTNAHNLPRPLAMQLKMGYRHHPDRISVTQLIGPARIRQLMVRHAEDMKQPWRDVSENIWALWGSAIHAVLAGSDNSNVLSEEALKVELRPESDPKGGYYLTGIPDLYDDEGTLWDYKTSKAFAFYSKNAKPEWVQQTNIYAWMLRKHGFEVKRIVIQGFVKDFDRYRALQHGDYPACDVPQYEVPMWTDAQVEEFIRDRVKVHNEAAHCDEAELPLCTDIERWMKPTTYAVKKGDNKRAMRVLDTLEQAQAYMADAGGKDLWIETRSGEDTRCMDYCPAAAFCSYYREKYGDWFENHPIDATTIMKEES
jgi:hypothetical protein